jgi:hypothetical protein
MHTLVCSKLLTFAGNPQAAVVNTDRTGRGSGPALFLFSAIGVNGMRYENADARQNKKSCCNIQHRTGP